MNDFITCWREKYRAMVCNVENWVLGGPEEVVSKMEEFKASC